MFDIITIGSAIRDITFVTDKGRIIRTPENLTEQSLLAFEYGAKIKSEEVYFNFGGGACNTAATFSKLGISAAASCGIGNDDDGRSIIKNLEKLGINTDLIQIDNERKTGFSLVVVNKKEGDRVIFVYKGASDFFEVKEEKIKNAGWIYLTSLAGNWEEDLEEINKIVENGKVKLAWNPGESQISAGRSKMEKLLKKTEIFIVNKDEAIELVQGDENSKLNYNDANSASMLCKVLIKWGPRIVIVTDGGNGAYLSEKGKSVMYCPAAVTKVVDTTGAGDSFGAALVGGYILTNNLETALKYGILNSAANISKYGAQDGILDRSEIEKRLNSVKIMEVQPR